MSSRAAEAQRSALQVISSNTVMKQPTFLFIVVVFLILGTTTLLGQQRPVSSQETGKIQGVVLDVNDARIMGAAIVIENGGIKRELKSSSEGDFETRLPAGTYQISVKANGFRKFELSPFKVKANVTEMINIHMEVAVISDPY